MSLIMSGWKTTTKPQSRRARRRLTGPPVPKPAVALNKRQQRIVRERLEWAGWAVAGAMFLAAVTAQAAMMAVLTVALGSVLVARFMLRTRPQKRATRRSRRRSQRTSGRNGRRW